MKTNKIVIVGGGSSGWMSATTLLSAFPDRSITVIESPDVPTVGVGESTPQNIRSWTNFVGISDSDFMKRTDATYKLSILFKDFYKKGSGGYHYPFGLPNFPMGSQDYGLEGWHIMRQFHPYTPVEDYARTYFPQMSFIEKNKIDENIDGAFGSFILDRDSAFHFDAIKFATWLRDDICIPGGVNRIESTVEKVNVGDEGVDSLVLDDGTIITADLYLDCTGFKSLLLGQSLKENFVSFENQLPNNRAWATQVNYVDKLQEMNPYTTCTAIDHGWIWNIPCWSRIGTGYAYSDKYISKEDALDEFKDYLRATGKYSEDLSFKDIPFRVGIHERTWVKNVVAIGLSAGFMEPLESNGLLTIYEFLLKLVKVINREYVSTYDQEIYNTACFTFFSNFADFVTAHYIFGQRRDNDYWTDISKISVMDHPTLMDFGERKMIRHKFHNSLGDGYHCIATGLNYSVIDRSVVKLLEFNENKSYKSIADDLKINWDKMKQYLDQKSERSLHHVDYLQKRFYS